MGRQVNGATTWVTWEARDAAVRAERERCGRICDEAKAAIWPYHDSEVKLTAETVCENLANRIRGIGA